MRTTIGVYVYLCFLALTLASYGSQLSPPYVDASSDHTESPYQWNVGVQGVTIFPGTEHSHAAGAGVLDSATVIGTTAFGMYGLQVLDTIDIPFYVNTSSFSHRIDFQYTADGWLHVLAPTIMAGAAKGFFDIWVDASIVDSSGNEVEGSIGVWDTLYRSDVSWAQYIVDASWEVVWAVVGAAGPGWVSRVHDAISSLEYVIPEKIIDENRSRFIRAPLTGGQWYKLRVQLGSKTGSAALGIAGCVASTKLNLNVVSVTTPGGPLPAPSDIWYPSSSASGSYSVSWPSVAGATSYRVERSSDGGNSWLYAYSGVDTSFPESLSNGSYRYRVRASSDAGNSDWRTGTHDCVVNIAAGGTEVTETYSAAADSYVYSESPDQNYGADASLNVTYFGGVQHMTLIRFGSMGLSAGTPISSAKLKLNAVNGRTTVPTVVAKFIAEDWTETGTSGVTWNNRPWTVSPPLDIAKTFSSLSDTYALVDVDITSFVREWVNSPSSNRGLYLVPGTTDMIVYMRSRNYGTSSRRPYLEVTFSESVSSPTSLSGPTSGQTGQSLDFSASGASSDLGHSLEYRYDWGDGSESSWGSSSLSKSYGSAGQYPIRVKARCDVHPDAESAWSGVLKTVSITQAHTAGTPNTPSGSISGFVGIGYEFSTDGGSCSHGHGVEYQYDWGDGSQSGWGVPSAFKSYATPGLYDVKVRARCAVDIAVVSDWSTPKAITITPIPQYTLSIISSGATDFYIVSSTGHGGTAPFEKQVQAGSAVNVAAPKYVGSGSTRKKFTNWTGAFNTESMEIAFDMDGAKSLSANYVNDPEGSLPPASGEVLFEDFESYTENQWASPNWVADANALDGANNYVGSGPAGNTSKVLRLYGAPGSCWGAITYRPVTFPTRFYLECDVFNSTDIGTGCHPDRGGIGMRNGTSWMNPARGLLDFLGNGTVRGNGEVIGTYEAGRWYHVKIRYDRQGSQLTLTYWLDGIFLKQIATTVADTGAEDSLNHVEFVAQEYAAWFDNLQIYKSAIGFHAVPDVPNEGQGLVLRWYSITHKVYHLDRATNLVEGFSTLAPANIPGTPPMNVHTDATANGIGPYFYKIRMDE